VGTKVGFIIVFSSLFILTFPPLSPLSKGFVHAHLRVGGL